MQSWQIKILFVFLIAGITKFTAHAQLFQDINKLKTEKKERGFNFFKKYKVVKSSSTSTSDAKVRSGKQKKIKKGSDKKFVYSFPVIRHYMKRPKNYGVHKWNLLKFSEKKKEKKEGNMNSRIVRKPQTLSGKSFVSSFPAIRHYMKRPKNYGVHKWNLLKFSGKRKEKEKKEGNMSSHIVRKPQTLSGKSFVSSFPAIRHYMKRPKNYGVHKWNLLKFSGKRKEKKEGNMSSHIVRKPKTLSGKSFVFSFPAIRHYTKRPKNHGEQKWNLPKSPSKIKKEGTNFHPSFAYLTAKYKTSELVRNGLQKFNILWLRVNTNKIQPKGVNKKNKKLKFDKDEVDIWNNKEREYSHN